MSSAQPPACLDAKLLWADALESLLLVNCVDQFDQASVETVWAWDGDAEAWELLSDDGPPGTVVTGFAWAADRDVLVRYGGIPLPEQECITETWEWDMREWRQIDAAPPDPCDHIELAWDASGSQMLLVGGGRGPELMFGTWAGDGSTWTVLTDDGPPPRAHHGLVTGFDGTTVELFGGFDGNQVFGDLGPGTDRPGRSAARAARVPARRFLGVRRQQLALHRRLCGALEGVFANPPALCQPI